jgi:hypothetical protein
MEWAIEQSREDHRKHQEVIAAAAFDSDEEGEAIERAIRESQLTKRCEEGNRYGQVRHVEGDGNEAMSINGHDVTQSERRSPGVQLVSSSWKSARGSGMSPVSSTRKEKKRKYATGSPIKVHGSPSCQRVLTDMFTTSPKKRKVSSEIEQIGIAPLPEQKQSRKVASEMESTGCPSLPEQPTGLHKKRRRPPPPLCLENPEQQDSAPSSAGTDKSVTPIKFSPHPSTLTKSGDRSFGGGCHEAVAEFVDNAIEASCGKEYATIEIHLFVSSEDEKKAAIAICDQGKGMTKKDIEDFACYSYNIKERHGVERPYQTSNESRHVDGRLSVYGVGSKNAAFHLGSRLTVITKCQDAKHMSYFCMDSQKLHSRFERNEETYIGDIIDYSPGDTECLHENELQDSNISNMVKEVSSHSHFTIILIGGLKKEHIMHLKKQHASEFRRGLAHIYHFYLHGIKVHSAGAETQNEHGHLLLQVLFYQQGKEIKEFHLKNETEDKESLYQLKAKSQFDFNVNLRIQEKSGDTVYQVKGVLLYFPKTLADGETLPFTFQDHELFECFWQGRLVTRTVLPCLNFCKLREQRVATQRDRLPDSCYRRLKGMLFFDRTMLTGHNKLSLLLPVDELRRLFDECIQKREEKKFNNWLSKCHKELDEEWEFCDEVDEGSGHFKTVKLCCSSTAVLRAGDKICVKRTNPLKYGEIKYFEHGQDSDYVVMDRRPQKLYPWTDKIPLSRLDFKDSRLDPGRWETCMDEQNRKLPVNLVVGCLEKGHCNLSDVVVCTPSNSVGSEGFWITLYDGNGETVKRLPGHKRDLVVGMRLQGPKTEHQIEGSTEGFNKVDLTDAGKHTFTFTIINRTKKQSIESQVVLLEWKHDVMVEADPPKVIHVISSDSEVRLGSESFSLHIEIMDQYRNPCKNVQATVALSCANKALQVVAPFDTFTTDESGRFLLSSIQFCPYRCSAQRDVIGQQRLSLLINKELNQKVDLTVSSGPPAGMELLKPLSVVEHNSVKENFVVKVVDAFNLPATVLAGEYYYVSARFLNNDIEGTTLQYSEALPVGSCNCIAIFRRLKVAFPDLKATNGQIEFMLWHREYPQNDGNSIEISRWVYDVHLIASTRPVRLLLYDSEGGALNDDEVLPAPVASHLQLEIEALDVKDQTVEVMKDSVPYRLQTTWTDGLITLKDLERGESQRLLLPPLTVTEKADSVICHSITLIEDDEEFPAFTINIKPQPGPASQVVIQKLKKGLAVGCGNKGDLHRLLSFFLTDEFGNKVHADETTNICAVITNPNQSVNI